MRALPITVITSAYPRAMQKNVHSWWVAACSHMYHELSREVSRLGIGDILWDVSQCTLSFLVSRVLEYFISGIAIINT